MATFELYLSANDQNPSRLKATDQEVSRFLDFFLEQQGEGGVLGDTDVDIASEAEGASPAQPGSSQDQECSCTDGGGAKEHWHPA